MVMFLSGFMLSSAFLLLVYSEESKLDSQLGTETKVGIGLGVGVLCGLMTMLVTSMGLFFCGLQLGGVLCLAILVVIGQFHSLNPAWVPLSAISVASILTAVSTLQWQKLFTVIYTSVFGAATLMLCVDYLLGSFILPFQVSDMLRQVVPRPFCWFNWAITGIWPAMSLMGVLVQWRCSAKGVSHKEGELIQSPHTDLIKF